VTPEQKALFVRAARICGATVTDFIVRSTQQAAEEAIRTHDVMALSARDSLAFVQALLEPEEPNEALVRAAQRYRAASA
jgi:uncharacterized protein (DUF1778 family)